MHRADLHDALRAALGDEHISLGARCVAVLEEGAEVSVEFADGRIAIGDVVIGADGIHSVVRDHLRHTHGSLLIKAGVPVEVVSERLGHAHIAHTIQTYQHLLPGMGADAARTYERLTEPVPTRKSHTVERRGNNRRNSA